MGEQQIVDMNGTASTDSRRPPPRNSRPPVAAAESSSEAARIEVLERENSDYRSWVRAIQKSMAVIEFNLDGTILTANDVFLGCLGYTLDEVRGRHHRMFVEPAFSMSAQYQHFWADLAAGRFQSGEFKRISNSGKEVDRKTS